MSWPSIIESDTAILCIVGFTPPAIALSAGNALTSASTLVSPALTSSPSLIVATEIFKPPPLARAETAS